MNSLQRRATDYPPRATPGDGPPTIAYVQPPPRQGVSLTTVLLLAILAIVVGMGMMFLLLAMAIVGGGSRTLGDAGQRAGETVRAVADTAARTEQDLRDRFDPSHPPRGPLAYDAEIESFQKLGVGQTLGDGSTRVYTLTGIKSRPDADRPELARYAVLHSELRQPREVKVLGLTIRRETDPRDDALYTAQAFRIGGQSYKG